VKRIFTLAIQGGKLLHRPHIPMLKENNIRTGFFEWDQFQSVRSHLPAPIQPVATFAFITGWRIVSEILPLEWRQVNFDERLSPEQTTAGTVRLDPGTTKNGDGRVFPLTAELRALLIALQSEHEQRKKAGQIVPWVFVRMLAKGRRGSKHPKRIRAFTKAWKTACTIAGCPGRIPHDFRRTAVRNLVRAGIPERVAMQMTGHKTRSVFERYNVVSSSDLAHAANRLNEVSQMAR
jgi:integrase